MTQDFTHSQDEDWQVRCAYFDRNLESLATLLFQLPSRLATPLFQDGDRVQWILLSENTKTDAGIVIGRFLAYAYHYKNWQWKYLIWLQPPCGLVVVDTAWEGDLELLARRTNDESASAERTGTALD